MEAPGELWQVNRDTHSRIPTFWCRLMKLELLELLHDRRYEAQFLFSILVNNVKATASKLVWFALPDLSAGGVGLSSRISWYSVYDLNTGFPGDRRGQATIPEP